MCITEDDYCTRLMDMPVSVNGFVGEAEDGFYCIYLNARLSHDGLRLALDHELNHITEDDFRNESTTEQIEETA